MQLPHCDVKGAAAIPRRRMTEYGLSVQQTYSDITDEELGQVISDFISHRQNAGVRTVTGNLNSQGIRKIRDLLTNMVVKDNP